MSDAPDDIIEDDALASTTSSTQSFTPDDEVAFSEDAPLSAEDRAMGMGWTPKGQFKGDPEKWVDAETFVKRGEEFLPFLKANNRRLEQALERANKDIASTKKTLEKFAEHHSKVEAKAYERAVIDVQARLDTAAASGDVQAARDASDELIELAKDATPGKAKDDDGLAETQAAFSEWKAENKWYGTDVAMTAAADAIGQKLFDEGFTGKAQGAEVTKRIKAEFPHKFTNPNRTAAAAVEGAGAVRRTTGKGYSDLPPDAKAICDDFVKSIPGFTRDKYAKEYFS